MDFRIVISTLESTRKHCFWNFGGTTVLPQKIQYKSFMVLSTKKKVGRKKSTVLMDFRIVISTLESTRKHVFVFYHHAYIARLLN